MTAMTMGMITAARFRTFSAKERSLSSPEDALARVGLMKKESHAKPSITTPKNRATMTNMGLSWENVDREYGVLQVRRTLQTLGFPKGAPATLTEPKTPRSRRCSVKLTTTAVEALKRHRKRQDEDRQMSGSVWKDWGLVFPTTVGTLVNYANLNHRSFKPLLKRAGLPSIRFHDLRHTCATLLLSRGVHPKIVSDVLGHASVTITLDTYSHVIPGLGDAAAGAMYDVLS